VQLQTFRPSWDRFVLPYWWLIIAIVILLSTRGIRFVHLVHALGRAAGGVKLPSVGFCLNASKAVSSLVKGGNDISRSLVSRKAKNNVTLLGGWFTDRSSHEPGLPYGASRSSGSHRYDGYKSNGRTWVSRVRCRDSESSRRLQIL